MVFWRRWDVPFHPLNTMSFSIITSAGHVIAGGNCMMRNVLKKAKMMDIFFSPCPFCSGLPEWVVVAGGDFVVRCSNCRASTPKARLTPEEAAADWNKQNINDDHFTITSDRKIDEYISGVVKKVLFSEYSCFESFPEIKHGFLCSSAVIITENIMLSIEPEDDYLKYDELGGYGCDAYTKPIFNTDSEILFYKSIWHNELLRTIQFRCGNGVISISANAKMECLMVQESVI